MHFHDTLQCFIQPIYKCEISNVGIFVPMGWMLTKTVLVVKYALQYSKVMFKNNIIIQIDEIDKSKRLDNFVTKKTLKFITINCVFRSSKVQNISTS